MPFVTRILGATALVATLATLSPGPAGAAQSDDAHPQIRQVLLLSIDGMHAVDLERYVAGHPNSALAHLSGHGVTYTNASTTKPSDSFPGLLAQVTGGTPKSTGVFYDDSYDRRLSAPTDLTCSLRGTEVMLAENLDFDKTRLDGGAFAPGNPHPGQAIDVTKLPLDGDHGCTRVFPHNFLRVNTIFEVIKAHGGRTAWSDKHPAYDLVNGPSGKGVDDLYTPEVDSNATVANGFPPGIATGQDNTFAVPTIEFYDGFKVKAVINWINGFDHTGAVRQPTPKILGMNFQEVSVAQKLQGNGYLDPAGTPSPGLADALDHADHSIQSMIDALADRDLLASTLIIVSAKHGQSPIDVTKRHAIDDGAVYGPAIGSNFAFDIADDEALVWLKDNSGSNTAAAVQALNGVPRAQSGIAELLSGPEITLRYQDPATDSRAPDIVAIADVGVIYTTGTKVAEHGGFADDDVHVALLVSNPGLKQNTITADVHTTQIAPTILKTLGIDPNELEAVEKEGTQLLPGLSPVVSDLF